MDPERTFLDRLRRWRRLYAVARFILNPGLRFYCLRRNRYLKALEGEKVS